MCSLPAPCGSGIRNPGGIRYLLPSHPTGMPTDSFTNDIGTSNFTIYMAGYRRVQCNSQCHESRCFIAIGAQELQVESEPVLSAFRTLPISLKQQPERTSSPTMHVDESSIAGALRYDRAYLIGIWLATVLYGKYWSILPVSYMT